MYNPGEWPLFYSFPFLIFPFFFFLISFFYFSLFFSPIFSSTFPSPFLHFLYFSLAYPLSPPLLFPPTSFSCSPFPKIPLCWLALPTTDCSPLPLLSFKIQTHLYSRIIKFTIKCRQSSRCNWQYQRQCRCLSNLCQCQRCYTSNKYCHTNGQCRSTTIANR